MPTPDPHRDLDRFAPLGSERMAAEEAARYAPQLAAGGVGPWPKAVRLVAKTTRPEAAAVYAFVRWSQAINQAEDRHGESRRACWRKDCSPTPAADPEHPVLQALYAAFPQQEEAALNVKKLCEALLMPPSTRHSTWMQLLDHTRQIANPIAQLLCTPIDPPAAAEAAAGVLTPAMLAQRWARVRTDLLSANRLHLPADIAAQCGLSLGLFDRAMRLDAEARGSGAHCDCAGVPTAGLHAIQQPFTQVMRQLVGRTQAMMQEAQSLVPELPQPLQRSARYLLASQQLGLKQITRQGYNTLSGPPQLGPIARAGLLVRFLA